ncbi:basement membrane-specific heparan sulfate proteoglycan core protein-like [Oncorhynchus clarkii lewisi]|uniref:basement membrane-specific heparan sulfate proteoglycan core protein-like n=1 Tax=Oncorhynchus clarkii lewisi TaxID=490388 RepID=UPI0039B9A992
MLLPHGRSPGESPPGPHRDEVRYLREVRGVGRLHLDDERTLHDKRPIGSRLSSEVFRGSYYSINFIKDFTETKRLGVRRGDDSCNLTISKTEPGDSATYVCSTTDIYELTYGEGTVLIVKDSESNIMSVLQQPVSESVQPGDSVTLNCTIHTETCAGEHSVYWFRHGSGESRPGIIYTHGNWSDQCEKSTETEKSCIYNLPKRNLSLSDAGTYYCAVASCGEILFGNWTKLDVEDATDRSPTPSVNQNQDSDVVNYAAVSFTTKKSPSSRRERAQTSREDAEYSEVRYLQQE